jgi:hypothetical protein
VKEENKDYSLGPEIGLEVVLNLSSVIETFDHEGLVPEIPFKFVDLAKIDEAEVKANIGELRI